MAKYTAEQLRSTHALYKKYHSKWQKYEAAYEGFESLKELQYFAQHERESIGNYGRRLDEGYGPNYSEAVINIFDYHIKRSNLIHRFGLIEALPIWQIFKTDCDYHSTDYQVFMEMARLRASIFGHIGIFVDVPMTGTISLADSLEKKIYPYFAIYDPISILDWRYDRDPASGRPVLSFLKLKEEDSYRIWTLSDWEVYKIPDVSAGSSNDVVLESSGKNLLGEIPFVTMLNGTHNKYYDIGVSDLKNIADLDISIYRNIMGIEEIINLAAFPMMRKPMKRMGPTKEGEEDRTGVSAVLEFDPSQGEAGKPDWLPAAVRDPIQAVLEWINWKCGEIYRNATLSEATAERRVAESGYALSIRKDLLNAALKAKTSNRVEAEYKAMEFWLKWINMGQLQAEFQIDPPSDYSVEQLAIDLDNALSATQLIKSPKFSIEMQKKLARQVLGQETPEEVYAIIDEEIEVNEELSTIPPEGVPFEETDQTAGGGEEAEEAEAEEAA